ncbi:MAG: type II secretion system protein [Puniceicoccaceae bacterium]
MHGFPPGCNASHWLRPNPSGMTILELVAVIAVISVLVALSSGAIDAVKKRTLRLESEAVLAGIRGMLEQHRLRTGDYPVIDQGERSERALKLRRLLSASSAEMAFDGDAESAWIDGWGSAIYYAYSEQWQHGRYVLCSCGPDGLMQPENAAGWYDRNHVFNRDNLEGTGR